jgi:hypothetical protein
VKKRSARSDFEAWFKRSRAYRNTVYGLRDAFQRSGPNYYYECVDDAWRGFKAGRRSLPGGKK